VVLRRGKKVPVSQTVYKITHAVCSTVSCYFLVLLPLPPCERGRWNDEPSAKSDAHVRTESSPRGSCKQVLVQSFPGCLLAPRSSSNPCPIKSAFTSASILHRFDTSVSIPPFDPLSGHIIEIRSPGNVTRSSTLKREGRSAPGDFEGGPPTGQGRVGYANHQTDYYIICSTMSSYPRGLLPWHPCQRNGFAPGLLQDYAL
jgi:hypothetical protein